MGVPGLMGVSPQRMGSFLKVGWEGPGVNRAPAPWFQSVPYPLLSPVALSTSEFSRILPESPLAVATTLQGWGKGHLYQEGHK